MHSEVSLTDGPGATMLSYSKVNGCVQTQPYADMLHLCLRRASYCEIYNEALYDLLHWTKEQLQVRWDAGKGFHVPDLAIKDCPSIDDMLNVCTDLFSLACAILY